MKPSRDIEGLLDHLCTKYGHCIAEDKVREIVEAKNWEPDQFAVAVLRAEGFAHPEHELEHRRNIVNAFNRWFEKQE